MHVGARLGANFEIAVKRGAVVFGVEVDLALEQGLVVLLVTVETDLETRVDLTYCLSHHVTQEHLFQFTRSTACEIGFGSVHTPSCLFGGTDPTQAPSPRLDRSSNDTIAPFPALDFRW